MYKLFLALIFLVFANVNAQQSIVSAGGTYTGQAGTVSITLGQVGYGYYTNGSSSISEGIQQSFENSNATKIQNTTICSLAGSTAKFFVTYTNAVSYLWEYKSPNATWKAITSANAGLVYSNYNSATLDIKKTSSQPITGTLYRVTITTAAGTIISNEATLTVSLTSLSGSILGTTGLICNNSAKAISVSSSHRGAIQWQSSALAAGPFTNVNGETSTTLNTGNLTADSFYRVVVTNGACPTVTSKTAKVAVYPASNAGLISGGNLSVCPSINSSTLTLTGYVGKIQWQYSTDNQNFYNVSGIGNKPTYTAKNLTTTTYYRVIVTNGTSSCTPAISESVVIIVKPVISAGTIAGENTVCYNSAATLNVADYQVGSSIQWKKSTSLNGVYVIPTTTMTTAQSFSTTNLTTSTYYKAFITYDGCSTSTEAFMVNVQKAVPGTITGGSDLNNSSCLGSTSALLLTGYQGTNIQWYASAKPTTEFSPIAGATSASYLVQNTAIGKTYYKASVNYTNCPLTFSTVANINVINCPAFVAKESAAQNWNVLAYPNPYAKEFMLKLDSESNNSIVNIRIFDAVGKLIENYDLPQSQVNTFKFGQNYASGLYEVYISQNQSSKAIKIIKE